MKIGIIGDIHGNLPALQATLKFLDSEMCDAIVCTGDIVGYGASPRECLNIIRERQISCVLGNHDQYVTLLMDPRLEKLDPDTRKVIEWTQGKLDMEALKWLAQLPLKLDMGDFTLVHGSLEPHNHWAYVTNEQIAARHFAHQHSPLAFGGHSHLPTLCRQRAGAPPEISFLKNSVLHLDDAKTMINVGAVGQPRDRDPRAACGTFDFAENRIAPHRVAYDIAAAQALIRQAGLPERFAARLELGK